MGLKVNKKITVVTAIFHFVKKRYEHLNENLLVIFKPSRGLMGLHCQSGLKER